MHSYLRAIGFGKSLKSEYDTELLLDDLFRTYQTRKSVKLQDGNRAFVELSKSFGPNMGIRVCGELDEHGFHRQYYYPYLTGSGVTTEAEISVERRVNGDGYTGVCDDGRVGVSLIFYVQNPADCKKISIGNKLLSNPINTTFAGLSAKGTILLPIMKRDHPREEERSRYFSNRNSMVSAAKSGNPEAIESLTIEDIDLYSRISKRLEKEDILSIVESTFMPYGMECDQYQIIGTILFYTSVQNSYTKETVYQLTVEVNGMTFDICINKEDLFGDPDVGRRFKGVVWIQGTINFQS